MFNAILAEMTYFAVMLLLLLLHLQRQKFAFMYVYVQWFQVVIDVCYWHELRFLSFRRWALQAIAYDFIECGMTYLPAGTEWEFLKIFFGDRRGLKWIRGSGAVSVPCSKQLSNVNDEGGLVYLEADYWRTLRAFVVPLQQNNHQSHILLLVRFWPRKMYIFIYLYAAVYFVSKPTGLNWLITHAGYG